MRYMDAHNPFYWEYKNGRIIGTCENCGETITATKFTILMARMNDHYTKSPLMTEAAKRYRESVNYNDPPPF